VPCFRAREWIHRREEVFSRRVIQGFPKSRQLQDRHWQKNEGWSRGCGRTLQEEDAKTWFEENVEEERKEWVIRIKVILKRGGKRKETEGCDRVGNEMECMLYIAK
jgi:hypothetical protein